MKPVFMGTGMGMGMGMEMGKDMGTALSENKGPAPNGAILALLCILCSTIQLLKKVQIPQIIVYETY